MNEQVLDKTGEIHKEIPTVLDDIRAPDTSPSLPSTSTAIVSMDRRIHSSFAFTMNIPVPIEPAPTKRSWLASYGAFPSGPLKPGGELL